MSIISYCTQCGNRISAGASFCTQCGNPINRTKPHTSHKGFLKWGSIIGGSLFGIFIVLVILGAIVGDDVDVAIVSTPTSIPTPTPTLAQLKDSAKTIDYKELFRYNEKYESQVFYFEGTVVQVMEHILDDGYDFRVTLGDDWTEDEVVYLADYKGERLLEDDKIEFIGESVGLETYSAIFGNFVTIPRLKAISVKLIME